MAGRWRTWGTIFLFAINLTSFYALPMSYTVPKQQKRKNTTKLVMFDLMIPGYGMFAQNQAYWGLSYLATKLVGTALIYVSVKDHLFCESSSEVANYFKTINPEPSASKAQREIHVPLQLGSYKTSLMQVFLILFML